MNSIAQKYKIGAALVLDGEKEYKQAITNVNKSMRDIDSQLKLTKSEFLGNENSLKSLRAQYEKQEQIVQTQKEKVEALLGALENAKKTYGENSEKVRDWEISLNKATAEFNKQNHALEELGKKSHGIGAIKTELGNIKEKAQEVAEKTEKLRGALAAVGKVSLKAVTTGMKAVGAAAGAVVAGATAAGKAVWSMANEAAAAGDEIDKMSQKLGMSAEAYQEWDYVLGQAGVDINSMQTGMKTLTNQIDDAKNGSKDAQDRFAKLGISMKGLKTMSREDIFAATVKGFQGMADSTERAALANDLFGKSGQNLTPLFNESAASTDKLRKAAHDLGFVMSNDSVKASARFRDSLDTLQRTAKGIKNVLAAEFLPGMTDVVQGLTGLFTGEEGAEDQIRKGVANIAESFEKIRPRIEEILKNVIQTVASLAPEIITTLINAITADDNLKPILGAASTVIMALVDGLISNLDEIIDAAFGLIETLAGALLEKENLSKILNAAVDLVLTLVTGIADHIDEVIDAAIFIIDELTAALLNEDNLPKLLKAALDILFAIVEGLIKAIPHVLSSLGEFLKSLADAFLNYDWAGVGRKIWEAIKNALSGNDIDVNAKTTVHVSSSGTEHGGGGTRIPQHATGLYAVPYDGYVASLHRNERILTAEEARLYNRGEHYATNGEDVRELVNEVRSLKALMTSGNMKTKSEISNTRDIRKMVAANA